MLLANLVVAMIIKTYIEEWEKFSRRRDRATGRSVAGEDDAPRDVSTDDEGNESSFSI